MSGAENPYEIVVTLEIGEAAAELAKLAEKLDWLLDAPEARDIPQAVAESGTLEVIGRRLWDAAGLDAEDLLDTMEDAKDDDECVRLVIQGVDHYSLPWELLYHDHPELGFLGRHSRCIIARRIRGKGTKAPTAAPKPLRLLLFISSPDDLDPERSRLDFEREEELLFTALDGPYSRGEIEIDVAGDGFFSTLTDRLSQDRYHAVILSMHGTNAVNGKGETEWGLLFEDEITWRGKPVAGSKLAAAFERLPTGHQPGLVVLAACRSARAQESAESIPDVARQFHRAGVERVLGMRLSVLDGAASAFNAALFANLALGESVGRAVSLARETVGTGAWLREAMGDGVKVDPFAQWTLPVLLDRTSDGPVVDVNAPAAVTSRPPLPDALEGDGSVPVPSRAAFIGRRVEIREALGPFLAGKTRHLLFTGPGGVGKTTLAGLFARHLLDRHPDMRVMGFRAPFYLDSIYEPIRQAAFDGGEEAGLHDFIQKEPEQRERLRRMLVSLANRERGCAFVLDNLESLQDLTTLGIAPEHEESRWFLNAVCGLAAPVRVLMTGRYALDGEIDAPVTRHPVGEAPYGDILRRMKRLDWPLSMGPEEKRWIYKVLGGNHRAIEWMAQLLGDAKEKAEELLAALESVEAPTDTPEGAVAAVTEGMRQNLLFRELREQLTADQDRLLQAASLYRVPVTADGLTVLDPDAADGEGNRGRLLAYALLGEIRDRGMELTYYMVPPVVRELLGDSGFAGDKLTALHREMGVYHRFQGEYVTRQWTDDLEAIHHFRQAGTHEEADELADGVSAFYHRRANFADAANLLAEIAARPAPPPPWWALNRYGQCQYVLGFGSEALNAFERALPLSPTQKEEGATLNNISQIYKARGDYDTALTYLEQSLKTQREIGDRAGEGATLNNISQIYKARGDYDTALTYLEQSLKITREIGGRAGEGATLNNISQIYKARGDYDTALTYLEQSLKITREIGDKAGEGATLNNISQIHDDRGDYDTALTYLEQSLKIQREIGDRAGEGATLNNISQIHDARGNYDTALTYLEQSLKIRREIGDRAGEGATLNNMATAAHARGDYDTALTYLEQSLKIQREIGDRAGEGATLNNISQIYKARSDYDTALTYLEQSLKIQREIGDRAGEGATLNNISQIYKARGDYDTALTYLEQSLKITREIGDKAGEGATLNNISQIHDDRGDYDTALTYLEQSLKIQREIGDRAGEGATLNNISQIYKARGDYDTALTYLEQSLKITREIGGRAGEGATLNNISQIYKARGDYDTALTYLEQSLKTQREIGDRAGMIPTLHNMAHIALQAEDPQKAVEAWSEALDLAIKTKNALGLFHVGRDFGGLMAQAGNTDAAKQILTLAVQAGEAAGFPGVDQIEKTLASL